MIGIQPVDKIRAAEREFAEANPDVNLMLRAADQVAELAERMVPSGTILVVVGPGNNGGDGLFAARKLVRDGRRQVMVWPVAGTAHPQGVVAARQVGIRFLNDLEVGRLLPDIALVIDGITGIGGRTGLPENVHWFAEMCDVLKIPVLAIDIPSGLAAEDHHRPAHVLAATRTITFAAPKLCHLAQPAASACGDVEVADIGLELPKSNLRQMQRMDVARWWPWPTPYTDKYSRGVLGIDTGSDRYPGAAVLPVTGAVYSGAGMIRFTGPDRLADLILHKLPSVTVGSGRVEAWLVGCGWSEEGAEQRFGPILESGVPLVIDADALRYLPKRLPEGSLLTPHAGELAELLGISRPEVEDDPVGKAYEAAERWETTVLLKGATQYIANPFEKRVTLAIAGPSWTAQAGSGDVLAGICGTLLAAGLPAPKAAALAASVQAMAAARKPGPFPPDVVAQAIPEVLVHLAELADQPVLAGDLTPRSIAAQ
ncbi:Bifunctional NAD(P)H-hydrate repair enzyme Nnr [bioreactor metagenome]|uniref:ADP-dependent (S)-NAD(P)H-hydrate dehydratase n=2 Tax=root TaxID=1 RepID=A0AAN0KGW0_9ACTN|nr:NAD(P)H-hydrate epimerase [Brooklawnia sp. SH051]BEH02948.1 bifunctional ADP-dependent NAD(P)H-hydrate dehydratase/NAD(P)H-hydrate epimerase [Brooklawnia sp. SH051]